MADQLIGQWWAHQLGLGYILPKDKVQTALRSIFKYNWLTGFAGFKQRRVSFAGDKDKGLLIVTWPKGGRPKTAMYHSDEVWTGIEYQVAAHMIYEGMIEEGFAIVKGARDRYDGIPRLRRSPATHGTKSNAAAIMPGPCRVGRCCWRCPGYEYDGIAKVSDSRRGSRPTNFKAFFSGPEGWGSLRQVREWRHAAKRNPRGGRTVGRHAVDVAPTCWSTTSERYASRRGRRGHLGAGTRGRGGQAFRPDDRRSG